MATPAFIDFVENWEERQVFDSIDVSLLRNK